MGNVWATFECRNAFGLMGSTAVVALVECDGPPETSKPLRASCCIIVGDLRFEISNCICF